MKKRSFKDIELAKKILKKSGLKLDYREIGQEMRKKYGIRVKIPSHAKLSNHLKRDPEFDVSVCSCSRTRGQRRNYYEYVGSIDE